jgi:hypothetical protein
MKIGRNQPCPCGSGKKFKKCHGAFNQTPPPFAVSAALAVQSKLAREAIRKAQQGFGRPIIATKFQGRQVVAVGNALHWSEKWKTFPDFLFDYIKNKIGSDWGNAEIAKPVDERHPLMQWYDALCRYQAKVITKPGTPTSFMLNGVVACYLSVAYGLYLLEHNVELQDRLIRRLKNVGNFQGAYYELLVASALIQAGFDLALEDESDASTKHCEFSAISPLTKKKYWIEAKMRAVAGQLGRTVADGTTSTNPLSSMIKHLNGALAKPAADDRMIFIDLNAEMAPDVDDDNRPGFIAAATTRLKRYERSELKAGQTAYVFITNANFHKDLEAPAQLAAFPFGLGIPDFNRAGAFRLSERYRQEKVHADALRAADGLAKLLKFPTTFDGSLSATAFHGELPPLTIGETYRFEGVDEDGRDVIGTVINAIVIEAEKAATIGISTPDGRSILLKQQMSDAQLADYRSHPDAYFGKIVRPPKGLKGPEDLFEFFMSSFSELSRDEIIARFQGRVPGADSMSHDEVLAIYCEGMVSASDMFAVENGIVTKKPKRN